MTSPLNNWRPAPELLAAYFDGECEGRDDLCQLKQRIEDWLLANPQAQDEIAAHRRLLHVWQETAPPEPSTEQWDAVLSSLKSEVGSRRSEVGSRRSEVGSRRSEVGSQRSARGIIGWSASVAAVVAGVVLCLAWNGPSAVILHERAVDGRIAAQEPNNNTLPVDRAQIAKQEPQLDDEILPVAHASEVTIVRVEGADTHTLVVGELPLQGILELVAPGDVILTLIRPIAGVSESNQVRLIGSSSPMLWARLDSEIDD